MTSPVRVAARPPAGGLAQRRPSDLGCVEEVRCSRQLEAEQVAAGPTAHLTHRARLRLGGSRRHGLDTCLNWPKTRSGRQASKTSGEGTKSLLTAADPRARREPAKR